MYGNAAHVCGAQKLLMRASMPYATCHNDRFASTVSECFSRNKLQAGEAPCGPCVYNQQTGEGRAVLERSCSPASLVSKH